MVINLVDIKTIGIVGAGQIGRGISRDYSTAGYQVLLVDVAEPPLTEALAKIRLGLERGPRNGEALPTIKPGRS